MIYLAVVAGALTMLLQTWAQAHLEASRAAVIMAMEPVWAAGFAVGARWRVAVRADDHRRPGDPVRDVSC